MDQATVQMLEPLSYFLGAWLGDGWMSVHPQRYNYSTGIACADPEIVERCIWTLEHYFTDLRRPSLDTWKTTNVVMYRARWHSAELIDLIYNAVGSKERLPNYIFQASKEAQLEMLAGLMDTDGCMSKNLNRKNRWEYILCFDNTETFVKEVPILFGLAGIKTWKISTYTRGRLLPITHFNIDKDSAIENGFYFHCIRKMELLNNYAQTKRGDNELNLSN